MNKSWLEHQVQTEKIKKVQEEKKDGTIPKELYRVRIKDKYRWDLWENDCRIVIAYSKDDAELKFTGMTGFNDHYYIEGIEKITFSDIEKLLLEN
ncbi:MULTISPECIES: hypothetical protein [Enterobacteriaceae]|uniref:hypothetical protein n=1 Tax=Enterobacterales TaxID=91347 RepID=UPI000D57C10D|nr:MULTISPECIES: hypothetical protein [Enterobacteriaceae]EAM1267543.1 hypothetical protein [Salmonella enterica]EBS5229245.1 hypothetical protein [Salmonella enterica subsp. enterica serovar Pomona]ECD7408677.1 hypothetical protein [Salmonella enterica subsp. enterica serovar Enteritidis]ECE6850383.1 hypothetical protein [Salmonella enterica subsp. diarizonae]EDV1982799.1 hypothetical protein [Salmonella enterica subsp. enterica serovar Ealing]HAV1858944.1 hypothetical protein [Enterobacter 